VTEEIGRQRIALFGTAERGSRLRLRLVDWGECTLPVARNGGRRARTRTIRSGDGRSVLSSLQAWRLLARGAILVDVERCRSIEVPDHGSLCGVGITGSHTIYDLLMLREREVLLASPD
jgi:hypothetical protein